MKLYGLELIKALSDISAPSGCEGRAAEFIIEQIGGDATTHVDRVGNVIATLPAAADAPKTLVVSHMDEPGFIVKDVDSDGKVWFKAFGGVPSERISGRRGVINGGVDCVFSAKPIHVLSSDERTKATPMDRIYAEIGAKDKESADSKVKVGDYGTFAPSFCEIGNYIKGKALGSRAACAVLIETIRKAASDGAGRGELVFAFTTRGEVGNMGAEVASFVAGAERAIIVDGIQAYDTPDVPDELKISSLGGGAVISGIDAKTVFAKSLVNGAIKCAGENGIKYQFVVRQSQVGEGAVVQRSLGGCECAGISIPTRYKKSASEMISIQDYEAVKAVIAKLI